MYEIFVACTDTPKYYILKIFFWGRLPTTPLQHGRWRLSDASDHATGKGPGQLPIGLTSFFLLQLREIQRRETGQGSLHRPPSSNPDRGWLTFGGGECHGSITLLRLFS